MFMKVFPCGLLGCCGLSYNSRNLNLPTAGNSKQGSASHVRPQNVLIMPSGGRCGVSILEISGICST